MDRLHKAKKYFFGRNIKYENDFADFTCITTFQPINKKRIKHFCFTRFLIYTLINSVVFHHFLETKHSVLELFVLMLFKHKQPYFFCHLYSLWSCAFR